MGHFNPRFQEEGAAGKQRAAQSKTGVTTLSSLGLFLPPFFFFPLKDKARLKNRFCDLRHKEEYEEKGRSRKSENGWKKNRRSKRMLGSAKPL